MLDKGEHCTLLSLLSKVLKWKKLHPRDLIIWRPSTYTAEEILDQIEKEKTLRFEGLREIFESGVTEEFISKVCGSNILFLHMSESQMRILSRLVSIIINLTFYFSPFNRLF